MFEAASRRQFLYAAAGVAIVPAMLRADLVREPVKRLKKAVKYGMIQEGGTVEEKFRLIKELGFDGLEMNSPSNVDRDEVVDAIEATGVVVHGVVNSTHWQIRHSDPDASVREQALADLETSLRDCAHYGGTTVLLVPGRVNEDTDESFDDAWRRSQQNIAKALPLAEELGVKIAIEVVWNDFLTTPDHLVDYVDEFDSPWVGAYFDSGNMIRYGVPSREWIHRLGDRLIKFDVKDYSHEDSWQPIGEGDEDWPAVRRAFREVGYWGWVTAEVSGGGRDRLRDISNRLNKHVLGL